MTQNRRNDQWRSSSSRSDRSGDRHGFRRGGDGDRRHSAHDRDGWRSGSYRGRGGSSSDRDASGRGNSRDERQRGPRRDNGDHRGSFRGGGRSSGWSSSWDGEQRDRDHGRDGGSGRGGGRLEGRGDRSRGDGRGRGDRDSRSFRQGDRTGRPVGRGRRNDDRRGSRPPQRTRVCEPSVPENVQATDLEAAARRELRALGRVNAENVSRHLVMVQRLLSTDPELAYQHARYATSHAGRVAVVRESAGIAAYLAGHYADALREIRAARRLSGLDMHRAIEADCERGLGRHQQALRVAKEADSRQLDDLEEAELAMVVSGVRHEMGQDDLGLVVIEEAIMMFRGDRETLRRLHSVRADRLEDLGRTDEAEAVRERIGEGRRDEPEDDVEVYDIEDDYDQEQPVPAESDAPPAVEDAPDAPATSDPTEEAPSTDADEAHEPGFFAGRVEAETAELLGGDDEPEDQEA